MQDVTGAKISQNGFRERHNPVFVPLGLDDADQHPGRINIGYLQIDQFAQSQPRSIKHFDHATVLDVFGAVDDPFHFIYIQTIGQRKGPPRRIKVFYLLSSTYKCNFLGADNKQ